MTSRQKALLRNTAPVTSIGPDRLSAEATCLCFGPPGWLLVCRQANRPNVLLESPGCARSFPPL